MIICIKDKCFLESIINFQPKGRKFRSLVLIRDENLYEWSIESRNGNRYHIPTTIKIFKNVIERNKGIPVILNHQIENAVPVGRVYKVWESAEGVWVEGVIDENEKDVIEKIENDILTNVSIHVLPDENSYQDENGVWWVYPKDVLEISLVGVNGVPGAVIEFIEFFKNNLKEGKMPNIEDLKKLIDIAENSEDVKDFISRIPSKYTKDYGYCSWIGAIAKYFWSDIQLFILPTKRGGHVIIMKDGMFIDTFNKLGHNAIMKLLNNGVKLKEFDNLTLKAMLKDIENLISEKKIESLAKRRNIISANEKIFFKSLLEKFNINL